jgi:hypothetical protein
MKSKFLCAATIGLLATINAEEGSTVHCFSPKFFYKHHNEPHYTYSIWGIGGHYHLKRPQGMNVKISMITNPQSHNVLSESENHLYYKVNIERDRIIYPIFSHRFSTHNVEKRENKTGHINIQTFYVGIGSQFSLGDTFNMRLELQAFRDLFSSYVHKQEDKYWGTTYSNPYGGRLKVGFGANWSPKSSFDAEVYYGRTTPSLYQEHGGEIAFNWGF